jgi:hypothetical protein
MKNNHLSILGASLILGVCFIVGCLVISHEKADSSRNALQAQNTLQQQQEKALMTLQEAAYFLGLEEEQVLNIMKAENAILSNNGPFTKAKLPYIKIDDEFLFNREDLLNWIRTATAEKRIYSGIKLLK